MRPKTLLALAGAAWLLANGTARAEDSNYSLLDSTYMEKGSAALLYRSQPTPAKTAGMAGVEWDWAAHPKLNIGLTIATVTDTVEIKNPQTSKAVPYKEATLFQVGARCESEVFDWRF